MHFAVKFRRQPAPQIDTYPHVILTQDTWDDYGYQTSFSAAIHLQDDVVSLGDLKILHKDQTGGYTPLPKDVFESLGPDFCSLGGSLVYYEMLFKLGAQIYRDYLTSLGDVAFNDEVRAKFEDLEGFRVSLLRFSGAERTIADASKLFAQRRTAGTPKRRNKGFLVKFKTKIVSEANSLTIDFDFQRSGRLPHRMNVVIGYNGTGKTRLLSNLAIVASGYGYSNKEDILAKAAGRFVGNPPPFKRVVVVSYSAFDTFVIPGQTRKERARLRHEGDIFGYVYCGLREHAGDVDDEEEPQYRLRTPQEIETEFLTAISRVRDAERMDALMAVLQPLLQDASFQRIGLSKLFTSPKNSDLVSLFRGLSSGHKIVLKIVIELTAYMDDAQPTLVLIDEPETHLHPPLLAALLKSVRASLEQFDGYAVIATHSPVVLQETPSRYVHVLKRISDRSQAVPASIETFGENIGIITQDVFNLDDGSTDWHDTLRLLASKATLGEIEKMFGRPLGFAPRSYIASVGDEE